MKKLHIFGELGQWAISEDDGCLRFHPQCLSSPEKMATWIWKEAFEEVVKFGGFDAMVKSLKLNDGNY